MMRTEKNIGENLMIGSKTPIIDVNLDKIINIWTQSKSPSKNIRHRAEIYWDKASTEEILNFLEKGGFYKDWEGYEYGCLPIAVKKEWIKYYKKEYCNI